MMGETDPRGSLAGYLTNYYRESLSASRLTQCDFSDEAYRLASYEGEAGQVAAERDDDAGWSVPFYQARRAMIASGRLPESLASALLCVGEDQDAKQRGDRGREREEGFGCEVAEVEIAWLTLRKTACDDGDHGLCDAVLLLPAQVGSDGTLRLAAKGMRAPMMPRALLDEGFGAHCGESMLLLGKYEAFREAADRAGRLADAIVAKSDVATQWGEYLRIVQACFDEVVDREMVQESLAGLGLLLDSDSELVQVLLARVSATRQIERLYESVARSKGQRRLALYNNLLTIGTREREVPDFSMTTLAHMLVHSGTMDREHCLSPSQRRALWCFLDGEDGSTLAVSGPPGTGKTTLLKAMVADVLVHRALEGANANAPIVVGTSTNNQAVTNIIDTFASVGRGESGGLFHRWLPDPGSDGEEANAPDERAMRGIGCFLPSAARRQRAVDVGYYVSGSYGMDGLFDDCLEASYRARAEGFYLEARRACLGGLSAHDMLDRVDSLRKSLLTAVATGAAQTIDAARVGMNYVIGMLDGIPLEPDECETLEVLDRALDTKVRPLEFWLAVHQFELRWLNDASEIQDEREDIRSRRPWADISEERYFAALANLTPLLCMTTFRVPGEFGTWSPDYGEGHMFAGIDLLIVDEAGQVSTPVGTASFALARRVVAMGDVEQIPPVWSFESDEDERRTEVLAKSLRGEAGMPATWASLRDAGLTASEPSSVMRAVQHGCRYQTPLPDGRGFFGGVMLTEHYRCQGPIIEVCNDLCYHGMLEPCCKREVPEGLGLAPLHLIDVRGTCVPQLTSRVNNEEAERVVEWIARSFGRLCEVYPEVDVAEVVGVISPFRQQAALIRELIRKDPATRGIADKVTVGTAHALQGAERRVVLFSLVYDPSSQTSFVNASPNLLNVAVSRAQDSFVVVGDSRVLEKADPNSPLGVLARHLGCGETGRPYQPEENVDDGVTLSIVLRQAGEDEGRPKEVRKRLRSFNAQKANVVLHELGYLDGVPGRWTVSEKGRRIGMGQVTRSGRDGKDYQAIVFNEHAADIVVDALTKHA